MILSFLKRATRAAAVRAGAVALGVAAIIGAAPAMAQNASKNLDWYMYVGKNAKENPIIVYFQSDASTKEFTPTASVALVLNPDFKPANGFEPKRDCWVQSLEFKAENARALKPRIIYGPNSGQRVVSIVDLPSFFAQQTVQDLLASKLVDKDSATPYFNCAGFVWANLMNQSPAEWRKLIRELVKRKNAEDKKN